ncbi:MAG: substrate-binding domain-containing protein, partial [Kiritimatiellae bacterium]|nr:substrate-binding domain-containing protein [Kiritimatiellia bacterium]
AAMERLLAEGRPPRGVYCMNDEMASGALAALREAGLRVPEDVRLAGTDDSLWARSADPALTTVRIDARHMGSLAVRLLLKRIASPDAPFAREILAPELVVRGS